MKLFALAAALLAVAAPPAHAENPIDFSTPIRSDDGSQRKDCVKLDERNPAVCAQFADMTVGYVASHALNVVERGMDFSTMVKRGLLAERIRDGKAAALTAEEISLIKAQLSKLPLEPSVVVQVGRVLDPASVQ